MAFPACTNMTPFRVSLRFVWFKFVGLAQTGQAIRVPMFLFFLYLHFYFLSCIITDECPFYFLSAFSQIWKKAMKSQCWPELNPFYNLLFQRPLKFITFFRKRIRFYLLFIAIYCDNIIWENTRKQHFFSFTHEKFTFSFFSLTLNSFAALQKHLNKGKQEIKLEKESSFDEIKSTSKISKGLPFCRGWLRFRSDLMKKFWWTIPC